MPKFEHYNIVLKDIADKRLIEYALDDIFFGKIDSPEVKKGDVKVIVQVQKKNDVFVLSFTLDGVISIPCDRCLHDMEQPISYKDQLQVKFGSSFADNGDVVIVPEADGSINVAWFLYEFIVLNIPMKHVHLPGECNKIMITKLKRHSAYLQDDEDDDDDDIDDGNDEEETTIDPRWAGLKDILDNN